MDKHDDASRTAKENADLPLIVRKPSNEDCAPHKNLGSRLRYLPLALLLVFTGGFVGLYFQPPLLQLVFRTLGLRPGAGAQTPIAIPAPDLPVQNTSAPKENVVVALGKLLPAGDIIAIAPPYGAADARIADIKVKEGDHVAKGAVLIMLDNEPALRAAVNVAQAAIAARQATLDHTIATVRANRDEARATLERAQVALASAQNDLHRNETLYKRGFVAAAAYEKKRAARDEAAREVERAEAALSRWDTADPTRQADTVAAQRNVDAARADLARAEQDLEKARVVAPIDGVVLTLHARVGEKPGAQGLMNIGDIERMTVEAEVYQSQIRAISPGDPIEIAAEPLHEPLHARVSRIGLEVGRQTLTDSSPAANTDARVVKVYGELDGDSAKAARSYSNLQVVARIAVKNAP